MFKKQQHYLLQLHLPITPTQLDLYNPLLANWTASNAGRCILDMQPMNLDRTLNASARIHTQIRKQNAF